MLSCSIKMSNDLDIYDIMTPNKRQKCSPKTSIDHTEVHLAAPMGINVNRFIYFGKYNIIRGEGKKKNKKQKEYFSYCFFTSIFLSI